MSKAQKGEKNSFYGKTHSEETKQKLSEAFKGEKNPMYGVSQSGEKNPFYGKTHTEETKRKMRGPKPKTACPHCEKKVDAANMKRWHLDNCKYKKENT